MPERKKTFVPRQEMTNIPQQQIQKTRRFRHIQEQEEEEEEDQEEETVNAEAALKRNNGGLVINKHRTNNSIQRSKQCIPKQGHK